MEAWSGAGKQPGTSLSLPLGRTTLMGNRRPEQELLRHPPPTQSTRVSTLWPAGGTLGPPPPPPLALPWSSRVGGTAQDGETPGSPAASVLWEEGQGEASDTGP